MATGLHISISAETLVTVAGLEITNSMATSLVVSGLLILFALIVRLNLKSSGKPSKLQNFAELMIESLENLVHSVTDNKRKTRLFFPFVASFFLFILLNNWIGLIPGVGSIGILEKSGESHLSFSTDTVTVPNPASTVQASTPTTTETTTRTTTETETETHESETAAVAEVETKFVPIFRPGTADLNTTLALALISMFLVQFFGIQFVGLAYFKKFFNFSNPIMFVVGLLELVSEFAKIISFAFRLFGNVFAGEVLLVVLTYLTKVVVPMPFYGLEIFVGFIQALVFSILSLVFFNMATHSHDNH